MTQIYNEYSKARIGWFPFGLTGWQAAIVAAVDLPMFWALKEQAWASAGMFLLIGVAGHRGDRGPGARPVGDRLGRGERRVRGRRAGPAGPGSAPGLPWAGRGPRRGWTCPGRWPAIEIHEGPPIRAGGAAGGDHPEPRHAHLGGHRSDRASRASGCADGDERARMGARPGGPDRPGRAHRARSTRSSSWCAPCPRTAPNATSGPPAPPADGACGQVRAINDDLQQVLTGASVRTEAFVTIVVPETRHRQGGQGGRPGGRRARPGAVRADGRGRGPAQGRHGRRQRVLADQPRAGDRLPHRVRPRGPCRHHRRAHRRSRATPRSTRTCRGRWPGRPAPTRWPGTTATTRGTRSAPPSSCPVKGAVMGALAPVLTPSRARGAAQLRWWSTRSWPAAKAPGSPRPGEWAADMGAGAAPEGRDEASPPRPATRTSRCAALEAKLVPRQRDDPPVRGVHRHRAQDGPDRRVRATPGRLDPPRRVRRRCGWTSRQDVAFAASVVPLGVSLTRRGDA